MIGWLLGCALLLLVLYWLLGFPLSAWFAVRFSRPRRLARLGGEPSLSVQVIVPCKGHSRFLEENLRAFASQDYPRFTATFVTNTPEDPANPVIAEVARGNPRVRHLVAGPPTTCAGKVHAQIVAVESDPRSEILLFGDSDMRPEPGWVREMVRPFLDPAVSVTTSFRWIQPQEPGLAASVYAVLTGFLCMYSASPLLSTLWGGAFAIRRSAYEALGVTELWSTTASDDNSLIRRLGERGVRPFFVASAVSMSRETHPGIGALVTWWGRQALSGKLHWFYPWLGGIFIETTVCLVQAASLALLAAEVVRGSLGLPALAAPLVLAALAGGSLLAKLPYWHRRDVPLWQWAVLPLFGHFIVAISMWSTAFQRAMTWGDLTYIVDRDGKVVRIEPVKPSHRRWQAGAFSALLRAAARRLRSTERT